MFSHSLQSTFTCQSEIDVHPHVLEEKAHLFHALDGGSAELETLNFLNALIYLYKPENVIETGTHRGFSAIAIAVALKVNGFGRLHTLEYDPALIEVATKNIQRYDTDLMHYIEIHCAESRQWLGEYQGRPFDFAFLDSEPAYRHIEFSIIKQRNLFSLEAIAMFHDTSRYRNRYFDDFGSEMLSALDTLMEGKQTLEFGLSRGFRLFKVS